MCFHSARLESKVSKDNQIVDLKNQDRSLWSYPLMVLGNQAMFKATENTNTFSSYHYEAGIAAEHLMSKDFETTNWKKILEYYQQLNHLQFSESNLLNMAVVELQLDHLEEAKALLDQIDENALRQRAYLFYGCFAEFYRKSGNIPKAIAYLDQTLKEVSNELEKNYLLRKKDELKALNS